MYFLACFFLGEMPFEITKFRWCFSASSKVSIVFFCARTAKWCPPEGVGEEYANRDVAMLWSISIVAVLCRSVCGVHCVVWSVWCVVFGV